MPARLPGTAPALWPPPATLRRPHPRRLPRPQPTGSEAAAGGRRATGGRTPSHPLGRLRAAPHENPARAQGDTTRIPPAPASRFVHAGSGRWPPRHRVATRGARRRSPCQAPAVPGLPLAASSQPCCCPPGDLVGRDEILLARQLFVGRQHTVSDLLAQDSGKLLIDSHRRPEI